LQGERSQFPWQGEDDVHVTGGQQLPLPCLEPAQARVALTLGAVPVSARNGEISITCLMESNLYWGARLQ
jgi:hypothetical protein